LWRKKRQAEWEVHPACLCAGYFDDFAIIRPAAKKGPGHSKTRLNLNLQENLSTKSQISEVSRPYHPDQHRRDNSEPIVAGLDGTHGRDVGDLLHRHADDVQSLRRGKLLKVGDPPVRKASHVVPKCHKSESRAITRHSCYGVSGELLRGISTTLYRRIAHQIRI
jgi:hypothetical protein